MDISKNCFFTGHRIIASKHLAQLKRQTEEACLLLINDYGVTNFIAGGALGFDTIAERIVLRLRNDYPFIKLSLYLPCHDQPLRWSVADKEEWNRIRLEADEYRYITDSNYITGCMQLRNHAMVKDSMYGIAYFTYPRGGTRHTVNYADSLGKKLLLLPTENKLTF